MASVISAGTTSTTALNLSGDTTGILQLQTNGTTAAMTIDTSQRVLIGTTSGTRKLTVYENAAQVDISIVSSTTGLAVIQMGDTAADNQGQIIYRNNGDSMEFGVNGAERMRIDSSGNVGIGNTPSGTSATGYRSLELGTTAGTGITAGNGDFYVPVNAYVAGGAWKYATTSTASLLNIQGGLFTWSNAVSGTAGNNISFSERMRINSAGEVCVGTTNSSGTAGVGAKIVSTTGGFTYAQVTDKSVNADATAYNYYSTGAGAYRFYVGAGGTVYATSTTITGISDVRLKENIEDIDVGLDAVMALKPRKFDWKEGKGKNKKGDRGWIAQEFEQVFPEMIDEWKDPAPEGEEPYKAVNADLIPVLVKAIQEQQAQIEELKAEVALLKASH